MQKNEDSMTLRDYRDSFGWNQTQLATYMGTSQPHISEWETGARTPSFPTLNKLAMLYEVPIAEIVRAIVQK